MQFRDLFPDAGSHAQDAPVVVVRKRRTVAFDRDSAAAGSSDSSSDARPPRVYTLRQTIEASSAGNVQSADPSAPTQQTASPRRRRRNAFMRPGAVTVITAPAAEPGFTALHELPECLASMPKPSATAQEWAQIAQRFEILKGVLHDLQALRDLQVELRRWVGTRRATS